MTYARLAWKCSDCGHDVQFDPSTGRWNEPRSDIEHVCPSRLFEIQSGVEISGSRDAQTSGSPANPDRTGADVKQNRTPVNLLAKRASK